MNEDVFNTSLRGFLKKVGITSQREIEKAVRDAVAAGRLKGNEKLPARMVLTVGGMPGLVPGIHVLRPKRKKGVDGRDEPGHDGKRIVFKL